MSFEAAVHARWSQTPPPPPPKATTRPPGGVSSVDARQRLDVDRAKIRTALMRVHIVAKGDPPGELHPFIAVYCGSMWWQMHFATDIKKAVQAAPIRLYLRWTEGSPLLGAPAPSPLLWADTVLAFEYAKHMGIDAVVDFSALPLYGLMEPSKWNDPLTTTPALRMAAVKAYNAAAGVLHLKGNVLEYVERYPAGTLLPPLYKLKGGTARHLMLALAMRYKAIAMYAEGSTLTFEEEPLTPLALKKALQSA